MFEIDFLIDGIVLTGETDGVYRHGTLSVDVTGIDEPNAGTYDITRDQVERMVAA